MFWSHVMSILEQPLFWVRVLVMCSLWYGVACILGNSFMGDGDDARQAALKGPWLSLAIVIFLTALGSWLWWHNFLLTALLTLITFIMPALILIILSSMDSVSDI